MSIPFSQNISMILAGGFRVAKFMRMRLDKNIDINQDGEPEYEKGELFSDARDRPVGLDFSGFNARLSFKVHLN